MDTVKKSYVEVHIAVFLFGITGLFGKWLMINPLIIVLGRVFFSSVMIFIWLMLSRESMKLNRKGDYIRLALNGALLALHWTTFFAGVQLSSVAIGLLTFSTFPVFVSIFTPILTPAKLKWKDLFYGGVTIVGILFVVPLNNIYSDMMLGAMIGVISGASYAVFCIYNQSLAKEYSGRLVALYEHSAATILLLPALFIIKPIITEVDLMLLIILGTLFTGIGHSLFINGLKNVSAYMASMITMLEPLYAIVLAYFVFSEVISLKTFIGGSIILGTVIIITIEDRKGKNKSVELSN